MKRNVSVNRRDFIRRFMLEAGLTYDQACRTYSSLVGLVEDGVVNGHRIGFGKVGCLFPMHKPPRDVRMGFVRTPGGVVKTQRIYHLDERTVYRFNFFRTFARKNQLRG